MSFRNDDDFDSESYVRVNIRLAEFHKTYPTGRVTTGWVLTQSGGLVFRAELYREAADTLPAATGHSFLETLTGDKVGEYTETVAVGRALAMMGFKIEKSLASGEEMVRFKERQDSKKEEKQDKAPPRSRASYQEKVETKVEVKQEEALNKSASTPQVNPNTLEAKSPEIQDTPKEVKKLTTSRIFKPLPKPEQQQTGGK